MSQMPNRGLSKRAFGAVFIVGTFATPAHAQENEPIAEAERRLGVITVTAERREENVQDVGQSIQAFDSAALDRGGVRDISRLEFLVSGANFAYVGNDAKINVRGANSSNTYLDNASVAGTFVDGIYQPRASQQSRAFFDIERLEFLKGPQGTLYGRNTFAAAVNLYTNKPDTSGSYASGIAGIASFNTFRADAVSNIAIADDLAIRFAAYGEFGDGYILNDAGPNLGAPKEGGFRFGVLWNVSDRIDAVVRYQYVAQAGRSAGLFAYTFVCRNVDARGLTDINGSERDCANPQPGSGGTPSADEFGPYRISQDFAPAEEVYQHNLTVEVNADFDFLSVKSLTSYSDYGNLIGFDGDFSPVAFSRYWQDEKITSVSQEIRLASDVLDSVQIDGGAYYSFDSSYYSFALIRQAETSGARQTVMVDGMPLEILSGLPIVDQDVVYGGHFANSSFIEAHTFGVFTQAQYAVPDWVLGGRLNGLRVIAGIRYSLEDKNLFGGGSNFSDNPPVTINPQYAPGVSGQMGQPPLNSSGVPTNPYEVFMIDRNAAGAITASRTFHNVSWRAGIEYDVTNDIMAYINSGSGFLSGVMNGDGTSTDEQLSIVAEIGVKTQLFDDRLLLNSAFYYTRYFNLLGQFQVAVGSGIVETFSRNEGIANAYGVDLEAVFVPIDEVTLTASLSWLNSTYESYGQTNPYQLLSGRLSPFIDIGGQFTPWSPQVTFGLTAAYELDLEPFGFGRFGKLTPYIQFYVSDFYFTGNLLAPDPNQRQDAYTKTDVRLTWTDAGDLYRVEVFVENIENNAVLARGNNSGNDLVQTGYLYPRNFGVRVSARF